MRESLAGEILVFEVWSGVEILDTDQVLSSGLVVYWSGLVCLEL